VPKQYESQSLRARWELAIQTIPPARLAQVFAANVGQIYDRQEFDGVARQLRDLYVQDAPECAADFQARLDRRLYDRYHAPVAWEVTSPPSR
jgi:hypothetical protein